MEGNAEGSEQVLGFSAVTEKRETERKRGTQRHRDTETEGHRDTERQRDTESKDRYNLHLHFPFSSFHFKFYGLVYIYLIHTPILTGSSS